MMVQFIMVLKDFDVRKTFAQIVHLVCFLVMCSNNCSPKLCLRYYINMTKICPRCVHDMSQICPRCVLDMSRNCHEYVSDVSLAKDRTSTEPSVSPVSVQSCKQPTKQPTKQPAT